MKYSKVLAALAFSAIISAESVALEPVRHTVFSTDMVTGMYNLYDTQVNVKVVILDLDEVVAANQIKYEEQHTVKVNKFGFLQFEIGDTNATVVSGVFNNINLKPSLIVKTYVVDGENSRIIDSKRMSEIIYNANVSRYSHMVNLSPAERLTGANVIDQIKVDEHGVLTTTYRALTPENIGAADTTQLRDSLALKVDKETGKSLMTDAERTKLNGIAEGAEVNVNANWNATEGDAQILNKPTDATETVGGLMSAADKAKLNGIEENATNYIHPANHPASIITQDANNRFVSDADTANWNSKLTNSLDDGYIFIGNGNNKPEAKRGLEGQVLLSNGVFNSFAKIKDINIADDAAILGKKITPDFGPASEITGGTLNVGEIHVSDVAPYTGNITADGSVTAEVGFNTPGTIAAGEVRLAADPGISDGSLTAEGVITALDGLISDGDITGVNITATGNITGVDITATGNVKGVDVTATGDVTVSGSVLAGEISIGKDIVLGTTGNLSADGTIEAAEGFIGTLSGNATTATNLEDASADNTVYLGNTTGNAWGKITNDHIGAGAAIDQSKVANLTTDLAAKANLAGATFTGAISGTTATFTGAVKGIAPVANEDLATKGYTDTELAKKANLAGAAFTGAISGTTATFTGAVKGIGPVADEDLATKLYVDTEVADAKLTAGYGIAINAQVISAKLADNTLSKDAAGLKLNINNPNTWTAAQTVEAKVTANEFSTATGRFVTGETLNTAWANVNKGANAVLEMGLGKTGLAAPNDRDGYGITINDDAGANRAGMGRNPLGWAAGVMGTTHSAGALVNADGTNARLMVANAAGTPVFTAGQNGEVTATTFIGDLNGAAATLAPTEAAGNSAVAAINLSTGDKIAGAKVDPNFGNTAAISGGSLELDGGKATSAATIAGDGPTTLTTKGYVEAKISSDIDDFGDFVEAQYQKKDLDEGEIWIGNGDAVNGSVGEAKAVTGDISINKDGLTAIAAGVIVDGDISATAGIAVSKLGFGAANTVVMTNAAGDAVTSGLIANANIDAAAGIAVSKLGFGAANTVVMTNGAGDAVTSGLIANANIAAAAEIADSKLATIATTGKVANSATTATALNTNDAIVARDGAGNFAAGTITAALAGNATTATALATPRNINGVPFDGSANIQVNTVSNLTEGAGITAFTFNGSAAQTIAIANNGVTNGMLAQAPTMTLKGNNTGAAANVADLTGAEVKAMLDLEVGTDIQAHDAGLASIAGLDEAANVGKFLRATAANTYELATVPSNLQDAYLGGNAITMTLATGDVTIASGVGADTRKLNVTALEGIQTTKLVSTGDISSGTKIETKDVDNNVVTLVPGKITSNIKKAGDESAAFIGVDNRNNTAAALTVNSNAGDVGPDHYGQAARFDLDNLLNDDAAVSISTTANGTSARGLDVQATGAATGIYVGAASNSAIEVSSGNVTLAVATPASVAGGITLAEYSSVYIIGAGAGAPFGVTLPTAAKTGTIIFVRNNSGFVATLDDTNTTALADDAGATLIFDGTNWLAL